MARKALIQVRRDTAANWTSTNPTLAAGEIGFETDTGKLKVGTGSAAWNSLLYVVDASDITGSTLASNVVSSSLTSVGTLGSLTVAGTTTSTLFRQGSDYLTPYPGFHNKLINGDFSINQRGIISVSSSGIFGPDRWRLFFSSGLYGQGYFLENSPILTISELQSCKGYRCISTDLTLTNADWMYVSQRIEDARTLAGQKVCFSFYNRDSGIIGASLVQNFGTGGSPSAAVATSLGKIAFGSNSRPYASVTLPSVQSKTFGSNNDSYLELRIFFTAGTSSGFYTESGNLGLYNNDTTITGIQLEQGSVPTAYDKRPPQTELALCQRYYNRFSGSSDNAFATGVCWLNNTVVAALTFPTMRSAPTGSIVSSNLVDVVTGGAVTTTNNTLTASNFTINSAQLVVTNSGTPFTAGHGAVIRSDGAALALLAEL